MFCVGSEAHIPSLKIHAVAKSKFKKNFIKFMTFTENLFRFIDLFYQILNILCIELVEMTTDLIFYEY